ncbi:vesicle transport v-SNARE protein, putative [Cryptosporidium muris RN66]|uniref:Vesicle transport v-SNARE protein, putative n=1 Tax=Cryptosporidium muris (strain RN66) TaxID=441375 RepID=B6AI56_CRYMR|nr:vesicle transport v-SNARE protein, putative [Cryptosporidium muris RN66]EEA07897.1 vesicle transport v-SNARE protein, putative [Cryptosporidium muris RN66]|eukprot:XP_002142246.1 vesicle transport v-SNARE protein [Cryptosporidium muris RN66]
MEAPFAVSAPPLTIETLSTLYPKATKAKHETERLLEHFELGLDRSISSQQRLSAVLNDFCRQSAELKNILNELIILECLNKSQQSMWIRRIDNLVADSENLSEAITKQLNYLYKTTHEEELKVNYVPNSKKPSDNIKFLIKERGILQESHNVLDHAIDQAKGIVYNIKNQNKILKSARKKALDLASRMGVSHSLLSVIERRSAIDQILVYGCIIFTLIIFFSLYTLIHLYYRTN